MKILIIDSHAVVRAGIRLLLQGIGDEVVCDEAGYGCDALAKVCDNAYDVVLLDLSLPDISGFEVLGRIKRLKPSLPLVAVSMHSQEQHAIKAYSLGADGFVSKESAPADLIRAIEKLAQGGKFISEDLAEVVIAGLRDISTASLSSPKIKPLSRREKEIAEMLVSGTTIKEIAWRLSISVKTVSSYKARILNKLHLKNLAELVTYVLGAVNSNQWTGEDIIGGVTDLL